MSAQTIGILAAYVVAMIPAAVLIGRWADRDAITDPYMFGVVFAFAWPLVALVALAAIALRACADGAASLAERIDQ